MPTKTPRRNSMFNNINPVEMIKKITTIEKKEEIKVIDEKDEEKDNNEDMKGKTMVNFNIKNKNISAKTLNILGEKKEKKKEPKNVSFKIKNNTKKTMVTENKIDLNFDSKKRIKYLNKDNNQLSEAKEGEDDDEELSDPSSSSSNISFTSEDISLNKLNEPKKEIIEDNKDDKNKNEKKIIFIKDNSVNIKKENEQLKTETKIINLKENLNNDKYLKTTKKDNSSKLPKIISSIDNTKINDLKNEKDIYNKKNILIGNKNNSNLNNNFLNKINNQNSYINESFHKNISQKKLNIIDNKENNENKPIIHLKLNDDDKAKKESYSISLLDTKKRIQQLQIIEYKDKNNVTKKDSSIKINPEIEFPQIKTMPNELISKDNYKLTENSIQKTFPTNLHTEKSEVERNISHRLNSNRLNFSSLMNQEKVNNPKYIQNSTENIKRISNGNMSNSFDNNDEKENKENEEKEENEKNKEKDKSNNLYASLESSKNQIRKIISSNYNEKSNNNAFLTSLNNISNSYNYYYNNNNSVKENTKLINILNDKSKKSEEKINKFNSKIDDVNVNIKTVNSKINILEVRYQALLKQINKIYKIVLMHYRNHKRKSTHINNIKEKSNDEKKKEKDDSNKNQKFMSKLKKLYEDFDNDYNIKIVDAQYNNTLQKIEPFLIKKFKNNLK